MHTSGNGNPLLVPAFRLKLAIAAASVFAVTAAYAQGTSEFSKTAPAAPPAAQPAAPAPAEAEAAAPQAPQAAPQAEPQPANPLGAGATWDTKTQGAAQSAGDGLGDPSTIAIVQKVNDYFNTMKNMQGTFLQTDPDNKQKRGKFVFERPGKARFDYSKPSAQKIISDGKYLAIEDHDLKTSDRYPLESTPFRMLLAKDVDFLRDARILSIDEGADVLVIAVEDKSQDAGGQIRLFFTKPDMQLKEWIITDPQGLNTRIEISNLELNKTVSADLFKFSDIALPNFR